VTLNEAGLTFEIDVSYGVNALNPWKRTGYKGNGLLGKRGPNHAADPIVVRLNPNNMQLEFVAIKRSDTGQWAIPGGMVDQGEVVTTTLKREFKEEAGSTNTSDVLKEVFSKPITVYRGYSDDHRNTDNAWIETTCVLFFPDSNCCNLTLKEDGEESLSAKWKSFADLDKTDMFASHKNMLRRAMLIAQNMLDEEDHKQSFFKSVRDIRLCKKRSRELDEAE
jgi:ADP-ribose pyrophosphatase